MGLTANEKCDGSIPSDRTDPQVSFESCMTPIHLENFDVFKALADWKSINGHLKPHWDIRAWGERAVACGLTWKFGESQLGGIQKGALSAQEAVELALEEFSKWSEAYTATSNSGR